MEVCDADEDDDEDMGTVIVGLMQKERRKKKAAGSGDLQCKCSQSLLQNMVYNILPFATQAMQIR